MGTLSFSRKGGGGERGARGEGEVVPIIGRGSGGLCGNTGTGLNNLTGNLLEGLGGGWGRGAHAPDGTNVVR